MMKNLLFLDELRAKSHVFVACSGGIDSMVLLHVLHEAGMAVHALHCNFQLRGAASDADETFVQACCEKLHIPISIKRFDTNALKKNSEQSIQQLARDLRYAWFDEVLNNHPNSLLCTAHHRDDHEEQVWLRLLASGRILDLGGILSQRETIRRPLLSISKNEILQYAVEQKITWREDSSNATSDYTRNKIRHELKPILDNIDKRNQVATLRLAEEVQKIRSQSLDIIQNHLGNTLKKGEFLVPANFWENQIYLVKELLLESWKGSNAKLEEVERFYRDAKLGSCLYLNKNYYVLREKDALWFGQQHLDDAHPTRLDWSKPHQNDLYEVQHLEIQDDNVLLNLHPEDQLIIKGIGAGEKLYSSNGKSREVKKIFNDQKWMHHERKKAQGLYLNGVLIGLLKPFVENQFKLVEKSSGKMTKIIKFSK
jgi:tRNA(Ile)-lysidine synthase